MQVEYNCAGYELSALTNSSPISATCHLRRPGMSLKSSTFLGTLPRDRFETLARAQNSRIE